MNTPKSQAQQLIDVIRAQAARGQISTVEAEDRIAWVRVEQQVKAYRAVLEAAARHGIGPDEPRVRPVPVESLDPVGHARHSAHMTLAGRLNTVGMLLADMDRHFHLSDVSDPEPHRAGVQVDATIAPHFYLATDPSREA